MKLLSVTETAEMLGVTRRRVLQWITDGRLNAERVGTTYAIKPQDVEKFATTGRRPTGRPTRKQP